LLGGLTEWQGRARASFEGGRDLYSKSNITLTRDAERPQDDEIARETKPRAFPVMLENLCWWILTALTGRATL
jgi:hypothetical protein